MDYFQVSVRGNYILITGLRSSCARLHSSFGVAFRGYKKGCQYFALGSGRGKIIYYNRLADILLEESLATARASVVITGGQFSLYNGGS